MEKSQKNASVPNDLSGSDCDAATFRRVADRVSLVGIAGNIVLSVAKLLAGLVAHSSAMVSDAVHSASDVFSGFIVMIGVRLSAKESDREHPYGHERIECVAAILLAFVLLVTGLAIGAGALQKIAGRGEERLAAPGVLALIAAVVSIVSKEAMFRYTRINARRIGSTSLMANAWHHRSDALSSVGSLIGIGGARLGYPILDPIAGLLICVFIVKAAYDIFMDAIKKMVDHSCDADMEKLLYSHILNEEGVLSIDRLSTRVFGNKIYVDLEIGADGSKPLCDAHRVAEQVHDSIEKSFPEVKHIMVHVNPAERQEAL